MKSGVRSRVEKFNFGRFGILDGQFKLESFVVVKVVALRSACFIRVIGRDGRNNTFAWIIFPSIKLVRTMEWH